MTHPPEWHQERLTGIGGSEVGSLLSHILPVDYGCRRALWLRKSNIEPDNPEITTEPMVLGNVLEGLVRSLLSFEMGVKIEEVKSKRHPSIECLRVNVDGIIMSSPRKVAEVKNIGRQMMYKLNEDGLCWDYIGQGNHGALIHGTDSFVFAVGVREELLPYALIRQSYEIAGEQMPPLKRPNITHWEMSRSQDICDLIEREAPLFWQTLGDEPRIPARLEDPEDPRCGRCPYQVRCRGEEIVQSAGKIDPKNAPRRPDLVPLRDEYIRRAGLFKMAEELMEDIEGQWKAALGETNAVSVPVVGPDGKESWKNVIYRLRAGRKTLDTHLIEQQYSVLRDKAIAAGLPAAELTPSIGEMKRIGMPSRPILLKGLLPKEPKKRGEVPEVDGPYSASYSSDETTSEIED